ncbi:MAG: heme biosynthesis protein, partial [Nitrospirae bacterium]
PDAFDIQWTEEASARFKRIPYFMQAMVKKSVEAKARERGVTSITPEFMEELRKARFGNDKPVFKF